MQQARSRFSTEQLIFVAAALVLIIGIQLPVAHYLSPKSGLGYASWEACPGGSRHT